MKSVKYPHLFSPMTLRGKTFRNRILVAPMGIEERGENGYMSPRGALFYEDVAAGGCARVCSGENDITPGTAVRGVYNFYVDVLTPKFKDSMAMYVDACHKHGALAFTSFSHMGAYMRDMSSGPPAGPDIPPDSTPNDSNAPTGGGPDGPGGSMMFEMPCRANGEPYTMPDKIYGVSDMVINEPEDGITRRDFRGGNNNGNIVHGMTEQELLELADAYAHCAKNAKECGLDGIILHGGHGFLLGQFIAKRFNHRTDQYGGSMENRARFPILVLQRIREAVGENFLIELRFSGEENISPISNQEFLKNLITIEDTVAFFKEVDKYPGLLDIAHISGGLHVVPAYNTRVTCNSYYPMAPNLEAAAAVKANVKHIAVAVVGSLSDPQLCEDIIREGKADFVVMARQLLIADPEFPNKAAEGRDQDINNCLRCTSCRVSGYCAVNPVDTMLAPHESLTIQSAEIQKQVVIVGGGIAGIKAAEVCALRGHRVTILEKATVLGGILRYTVNEPHKTDIKRYYHHMIDRIQTLGVSVRTGVMATPELVVSMHPDAVIVAIGGQPTAPSFPVAPKANILDATNAYLHPENVGQTLAILGGGLTGVESAIHWAERGKQVTLISRSKQLLSRVKGDGQCVNTHLLYLSQLPIDIRTGCACTGITPDGVQTTEGFIPADTVIHAIGMSAVPDTVVAFQHCAPQVIAAGDCTNPQLIGYAVRAAYEAAIEL